jgi:SAM-dependent methyltransferase
MSNTAKKSYQRWQADLFKNHWFSRVFVRVMGELAHPIYEWAWHEMAPDLVEAKSLADVGCGNGLMSRRVARGVPEGGAFTLVDASASQLEAGRDVMQEIAAHHTLTTYAQPAERLPMADASVDALYTTGSINLWDDPVGGLVQCARVVKKGGILWLFDQRPCNTVPLALDALFKKRVFGLGLPGYSLEEVLAFGEQAGLTAPRTVEDMSLYGIRWEV